MALFSGILKDMIDSAKPAVRDALQPQKAAERKERIQQSIARGNYRAGQMFKYIGKRDTFNEVNPGDLCMLGTDISVDSELLPVMVRGSSDPVFLKASELVLVDNRS